MKSLISEIVKIQLIRKVLSEGRVEDAKAKFPKDADAIDYFVSQDPSGNNKYLNWEMKVYKQLPPEAPAELKERHKELIANLIKGFHQHSTRLQMRDINQYKSLADLNTAVSPLIKASEEKAAEKLKQEEGSLKLYEDTDWLLIVPLTYEASCKYGANTQWCVASRDTKVHFKSYTSTGLLIYLIHKKSNNKFAFYHDYDNNRSDVEIYNPIDNDISSDYNIDSSVENFLQGLVDGKLEEYLQDNDDYDYDDDYEYEIIWTNRNGQAKTGWEYDEEDLHMRLVGIVLEYFLGRGSGRNTLQKYKDVFRMFGITLELHDKKQDSTFSLRDSDGELENSRDWVVGRDVKDETHKSFNFRAKQGYFHGFLEDYLFDNSNPDEIMDMARAGGMNIRVVGPGYEEREVKKAETKVTDLTRVMSEKQASSIYKAYSDYSSKAEEEKNKKIEREMSEILAGVTVNTQKFEVCYNPDDKIFDILGSLPELKRTVVQELRYEGIIKGRLPRNWPSTPEQKEQFLSQSEKHHFLLSCLMGLNGGLGIGHMPITKITKNNKKRASTLSWLYDKLSEIGLRMNGYEGLLRMLIDRQKTKK